MEYSSYLKSRRWLELRAEALERDGCRCRTCNSAEDLEVHHRRYPAVFGTETVDDLTTLCRSCHEAITAHLDRQRFRKRVLILADAQRITPTLEGNPSYGVQHFAFSDYRRLTPGDAQRPTGQSAESIRQGYSESLWETKENRSGF